MKDVWLSLRSAFEDGHRRLTQGIDGMIDALQRDDYQAAVALADDLDRRSGPHVEFEERYVFPVVERHVSEAYAVRLYNELAELVAILTELKAIDPVSPPSPKAKQRWLAKLKDGLGHLACTDPLLNHLATASSSRKAQLLQRHHCLHQRAHRWSQLHPDTGDR